MGIVFTGRNREHGAFDVCADPSKPFGLSATFPWDATDAAIGMALKAFFLGVDNLLLRWPECEECDGWGMHCDACESGFAVDWKDALRRAGWTGPEVRS